MNTYDVEIERAVSLTITVNAADEEKAKQLALEEAHNTDFGRAPCPEYKILDVSAYPKQDTMLNEQAREDLLSLWYSNEDDESTRRIITSVLECVGCSEEFKSLLYDEKE